MNVSGAAESGLPQVRGDRGTGAQGHRGTSRKKHFVSPADALCALVMVCVFWIWNKPK